MAPLTRIKKSSLRIGMRVFAKGYGWKIKSIDRKKNLALLSRKYLGNEFGPCYAEELPLSMLRRPLPTVKWG